MVFPLCLAPVLVLGAGKTLKPAGRIRPRVAIRPSQPAADQGPSDPRADNDAEQADSDKPDADTADSDKPEPPKTGSRPTSMIIIPERNGLKTLNIHFRWSIYPNASIEVRLVPGVIRKGATVSPVYFLKQLKGKVQEALFTCLDHPGDGGRTYSFTKDKLSYTMVGCRNSLGSQGAYVKVQAEDSGALQQSPRKPPSGARVQPVPRLAEDLDSPDPNPAAAFCSWIPGPSIRTRWRWTWHGTSFPSRARSSSGSFAVTGSCGKSRFAGRDTSNRLVPVQE